MTQRGKKPKPRCARDGKAIYHSFAHALRDAGSLARESGTARVYRGDCGHWHLTRMTEQEWKGKKDD